MTHRAPTGFMPSVGEQIRFAYEQALHNTRDADVVGRLGMVLQCYGKYEPAEICYRRAWGLSPHTFRWVYYLGNIEAYGILRPQLHAGKSRTQRPRGVPRAPIAAYSSRRTLSVS
jgi:hypothetical protein